MTIRELISCMSNDIRQDIEITDKKFRKLELSVKLSDEEEQDNELLDLIADNRISEWYIDYQGTLKIYLDYNAPQIDLNPYYDPAEYEAMDIYIEHYN